MCREDTKKDKNKPKKTPPQATIPRSHIYCLNHCLRITDSQICSRIEEERKK